jgi:predicted nucleic acid-binding protein
MSSYVVDSWAWLEYLDGTEKGSRIRPIIEGQAKLFTHASSVEEIVSKARRRGKDPKAAAERVLTFSRFISPTVSDAVEAGLVHAETRKVSPNFSLGDAFVLQLARKLGCKVLTGDPDFRKVKEAELIG